MLLRSICRTKDEITISTASEGMVITASAMVRTRASTSRRAGRGKAEYDANAMPRPAAIKPTQRARRGDHQQRQHVAPVAFRTERVSRIRVRKKRGMLFYPDGRILSGVDATQAWVTSQNSGPTTPSRTTNITMLKPMISLGFSQGESQRLRRASDLFRQSLRDNHRWDRQGSRHLLSMIRDPRVNEGIEQINNEDAECHPDNQKINQTPGSGCSRS